MALPTSQLLKHVAYWMQKAEHSQCQSIYMLAAQLAVQAEQLRTYRYGRNAWVQEQADAMKEGIGKLLHRLIELLSEQDEEAEQFYGRVRRLLEQERLLRAESVKDQEHGMYYLYLAAYVHQSAERFDLDEELLRTVSAIVEERPK